MFVLKPNATATETKATNKINPFHFHSTYGMKSKNKLTGIIILEYNSSFVTKERGISKNPNGMKIFKKNFKVELAS